MLPLVNLMFSGIPKPDFFPDLFLFCWLGPESPTGLCLVSAFSPSLASLTGCKSSLQASPHCASRTKTKKIMYDSTENDDFDREEIPTYEEVAKLFPRPGVYRPIILIGPPGVGRNELRRRLIATDPEKFRTPTPCKNF